MIALAVFDLVYAVFGVLVAVNEWLVMLTTMLG